MVNAYKCKCQPGFTGKNCEININECKTNKVVCKNGGRCQDLVNAYKCQCKPGFTGKNCEIKINKCQFVQCRNGGSCKNLSDGKFKCVCKPGFSGIFCQTCKLKIYLK